MTKQWHLCQNIASKISRGGHRLKPTTCSCSKTKSCPREKGYIMCKVKVFNINPAAKKTLMA